MKNGIFIENGKDDNLFINFASWFGSKRDKLDNFQFRKALNIYPNSYKMFIRDLNDLWYLFGIDEFDSIEKLSNMIKDFCLENKIKNIYFTGSSMGGFASLLYGELLSQTSLFKCSSLSFSPQTNIDNNMQKTITNNWLFNQLNISVWPNINDGNKKYLDLNNILTEGKLKSLCICSSGNSFDSSQIDLVNGKITKTFKINARKYS